MFTIEADILNTRARELARNGRWSEGQRFLKKCFPDMAVEDTYRIMSGTTRLVNVDGVTVDFAEALGEPPMREQDLEHKDWVDRVWDGTLKTKWGYFKPYAYTNNYGREDLSGGKNVSDGAIGRFLGNLRAVGEVGKLGGAYVLRPLHYADDPDNDLFFELPLAKLAEYRHEFGCNPVIFHQVSDLPPWVEPVRTPWDAVMAMHRRGGRLSARGHFQTYGIDWVEPKTKPRPLTDEDVLRHREAEVLAENRRELDRRAKCEATLVKIMEQMTEPGKGGWLEMPVGPETIRVPKAPFEHWALDRCGAGHIATPWRVCSEPGMKKGMTDGDDPLHTDWMLGAGIDPLTVSWYAAEDKETESLRAAAMHLMGRVQEEKLNFSCAVLTGGGVVIGPAFVASYRRQELPEDGAIVVLPDASAHWLETVLSACGNGSGGVIVAKGGALAHLVVETRAHGVNVAMVANATKLYVDGQVLIVDCNRGRVTISSADIVDDPSGGFGGPGYS